MPTRNVIKEYDTQSYYHIYSRGVDKKDIFREEADFTVFVSLFKRYLSPEVQKTPQRLPYPNYSKRLELLCYAFMSNHIHLFVYQDDSYAIRDFMRALLTSYSMYFNKKYKRVGPLFQSRYLASRITNDSYYEHISRYIHMNPKNWRTSKHTSLDFFLNKRTANWIHPERIIDTRPQSYFAFLESYDEIKDQLDDIKWHLANSDN